jgi:acyl carrier protein
MKRELFVEHLTRFIEEKNEFEIEHLSNELNLIESGLIDSFMIIELILYVEELLEAPVETENLKVENISSIDRMCDYFLQSLPQV